MVPIPSLRAIPISINVSRLTSLCLEGSTGTSFINKEFLELPFLCLRRLSLSREIAIHQENLATLLRHTPQLRELSLGIHRLTRVPVSLLTCLLCLHDTELRESHDDVLQFVDQLPRVTFTKFRCTPAALALITPLTLGRICKLRVAVMSFSHSEAVMRATSLKRLRLTSFSFLASQPPLSYSPPSAPCSSLCMLTQARPPTSLACCMHCCLLRPICAA